jgi:AcrR family transcriptional regulator
MAGARVDRIAQNAAANKAMLYRYFQSKEALFDAVFAAHVVEFVDIVRFDPDDLPAYAGRLFDSYRANPVTLRLTHWYQLERADSSPPQIIQTSNRAKLAAIADAQKRGAVSKAFRPPELMAIVRSIAMAWDNLTPELDAATAVAETNRRASVVDAVSRLVAV